MAAKALAGELDQLLHDKYELQIADIVRVLRTMPVSRPSTVGLPRRDAELLDRVGFTEDPHAYPQVTVEALAHMARLVSAAASTREVAAALGVNDSRIRQRRLAHSLWAIDSNGRWVFPTLQFESDPRSGRTRLIRGLDQVLAALPVDLHPVAVANFLDTAHPDLAVDGRPCSPRDWLRGGGEVGAVLRLVEIAAWAGR